MSPARRIWRWARIVLVVVAALAASLVAMILTVSNTLPATQSPIAVQLPFGGSGEARAQSAFVYLSYPTASRAVGEPLPPEEEREMLARARRLAQSSLVNEPANVTAARTLALLLMSGGEEERAKALLEYADGLSRRDSESQIALAALAIEEKRLDDAALYLGRVIITSPRSRDVAMAQIRTAAVDPAFRQALGRSLAQDPPWKLVLLNDLARSSIAPAILHDITSMIWSDGVPEGEREMAERVIDRLVERKAHEEAFALYRRLAGAQRANAIVRDGGFEGSEEIGPFEWAYADTNRISAIPLPSLSGEGRVLQLEGSSGSSGVAARQITRMAPGSYALSVKGGDVSEARFAQPEIRINCLDSDKTQLLRHALPPAPEAGRASMATFDVPASCSYQAIEIRMSSPSTVVFNRAWVDDIAIRRE